MMVEKRAYLSPILTLEYLGPRVVVLKIGLGLTGLETTF